MTLRCSLLLCLVFAFVTGRTATGEEPKTLPLWPKKATDLDSGDANHPGDVPTITVYAPPSGHSSGAAILICPGGGYGFLATDHEGIQVAEWLNTLGITGVVLKYRLAPKYRHPAPLDDARQAIRMIRLNAESWGIDPNRVGVLGFSAGGHLASTLATHFREGNPNATDAIDKISERPDVAILVYPVVSFVAEFSHKGSANNLLGTDASKEQLTELSNETQVTAKTPPSFLAHTLADDGVPMENSIVFAQALRKHKVPFELHIFEKGPHGLGLGKGTKAFHVPPEPSFEAWPALCATWLKARNFTIEQPGSK